jgi:hypothetical protein
MAAIARAAPGPACIGNETGPLQRAGLNQLECECDALSIHPSADKDQILRALHLLHEPNSVVELRIPGIEYGTKAGYFNDWKKLADAAVQYSGHCPGIYVTVNPLDPRLLYRAANHVTKLKNTTADADILCRRWLPIDFDALRPAGISSTDQEHELALARARECRAYVIGEGWPEPLLADSGNGAHLLCRIDLPNDDASRDLVKRVLVSRGRRFTDDQVAVDPATFNAARIWKLYGTQASKGSNTSDRPHRMAAMVEEK